MNTMNYRSILLRNTNPTYPIADTYGVQISLTDLIRMIRQLAKQNPKRHKAGIDTV